MRSVWMGVGGGCLSRMVSPNRIDRIQSRPSTSHLICIGASAYVTVHLSAAACLPLGRERSKLGDGRLDGSCRRRIVWLSPRGPSVRARKLVGYGVSNVRVSSRGAGPTKGGVLQSIRGIREPASKRSMLASSPVLALATQRCRSGHGQASAGLPPSALLASSSLRGGATAAGEHNGRKDTTETPPQAESRSAHKQKRATHARAGLCLARLFFLRFNQIQHRRAMCVSLSLKLKPPTLSICIHPFKPIQPPSARVTS